jgi:hypothetical protein
MSEINLQLVRDFFELNRFSVLTHWRHSDERAKAGEDASLLFVEHLRGEDVGGAPFLLTGNTIQTVQRAVVEVRAWHGDRFYPSVIESSPILAHVASREVEDLAREVFGGAAFTTILVISELPASAIPRARALQLLQELGIGHILEFGALLSSLAAQLSSHGNYAPSHTLQTLRLLKRYDLIRRQQLELPFPQEPLHSSHAAGVDSDLGQQREIVEEFDGD